MRLVLFDCLTPKRLNFHPLALSRPIFELRCGITSLGDKLIEKTRADRVACFVPPYLAETYRTRTPWPVNSPAALQGDDLLLVNGRVKAASFDVAPLGPRCAAIDADGEVLYARIARNDLAKLSGDTIDALLESAKAMLPTVKPPAAWNYIWELILANSEQLTADFAAAGRSGIEGIIEEPRAIRASPHDVFIARDAVVHPMAVIDAEHGPVYLDEGVVVHPFTRIEGPCYVGKNSILLGCKCRAGNSIGPMCRVGGEVEDSIVQSHSNKYHEGFLGHAYVGQWVNLGAMTTNSDLKNDYSDVSIVLDGRTSIHTGSTKVGALIGDHAKTAIGTLFNTGAYVGAMTLLATPGVLLPKFLSSFTCYIGGAISDDFGKEKLYATARRAMIRRNYVWTAADAALWDAVYEMTAPSRAAAIERSRKQSGR